MLPVSVRVASSCDAQKIAEVHVSSWHETYRGLVPDAMLASLSIERRAEAWLRMLANPAAANDLGAYVAESDGKVVGFGACCSQRSESLRAMGYDAEIASIYILSAWHRRGVGRALVRAMTDELLTRGRHGVALWVLRSNARARGFYEWCGGQIVTNREDARGDAVLFEVAYGWPEVSSLNRKVG